MKRTKINDGCELIEIDGLNTEVDEERIDLGLVVKITDLYEMTGEEKFKQYPFIVEFGLMSMKPIVPGLDSDLIEELVRECDAYWGLVPVEQILISEFDDGLKTFKEMFKIGEACLITEKHDSGTIAVQYGQGTEFEFIHFKTPEQAKRLIEMVLIARLPDLIDNIDDILDSPINLAGDTGRSLIEKQTKGV